MPLFRFTACCLLAIFCSPTIVCSQDEKAQSVDVVEPSTTTLPADLFVDLAEKLRDTIVTISHQGRTGEQEGLGTGFVIDRSGLIATSRHVIGEARPIEVHFRDGTRGRVASVHATDARTDLAILKLDLNGNSLPEAIPLANESTPELPQGELVAAIGHPLGLKNTLVTGIVSGQQTIEQQELIQVAMPIDHGNSGGPLVNRAGEVIGIITYKSSVTENVGFAMPVRHLQHLLKDPNPITIDQWITIGALDQNQWTTLFGGNWRQRAGRIHASGQGSGFGGRTLCLAAKPAAEQNFEIAVEVKLDDESGAAGLVLYSDGKNRHYGFYPSSGRLRFSRFDGPDVFRWNVLREEECEAYRPGDWNRLKVRVSPGTFECFCNGAPVYTVHDDDYTSGLNGLAKFRDTHATFRKFEQGVQVAEPGLAAELEQQFRERLAGIPTDDLSTRHAIDRLEEFPAGASDSLANQARELEQRATALRQLANRLHEQHVRKEIQSHLNADEISLAKLALLLAWYDNSEVNVNGYERQLERMAGELRARLSEDLSPEERRRLLDEYLFEENGFHGSRTDFYSVSNSYLNEVLDDREGLPVTLSVLYAELATRIGLDIRGIGLPGHFVVAQYIDNEPVAYVDVFAEGHQLSALELGLRLPASRADGLDPLKPQSPRQTLIRMVNNLKRTAEEQGDFESVHRYLNLLIGIDSEGEAEYRYVRTLLEIRQRDAVAAEEDLAWLEEHASHILGPRRLSELRQFADNWLKK